MTFATRVERHGAQLRVYPSPAAQAAARSYLIEVLERPGLPSLLRPLAAVAERPEPGSATATALHVPAGVTLLELYLHQPDADYLLSGRQVVRIGPDKQALPTIGTVPPPGGGAETRDLLRAGPLLLVIDGGAGRVIAMDARNMGWRFEKRFITSSGHGGRVTRLRAALGTPNRLYIVTAEETSAGQGLYGLGLTLEEKATETPQRLSLDPKLGRLPSNHELLPVAAEDGGGVLLCYSRPGNTGPEVAVHRLEL